MPDAKMGVSEVLRDGRYLPPFLRDFHMQKDVFKSVDEWARGGRPIDSATFTMPNWIDAHIYTVDYFLHFMAAHGWTLQRSRMSARFCDLDATLRWRREREAEAFKAMLLDRGKVPQ